MLKIVNNMSQLHFAELMKVYLEGNLSNGAERYFRDPPDEQLYKVQTDFYHYLNSVFFHQPNSCYAIWEHEGVYVSALRLEPYADGLLLCALETAPDARGKGYATALICAVMKQLCSMGSGIIYSHISKNNTPSIAVHKNCGFKVVKDYAVYSDGSVMHNHFTFAYKYEKSEI